MKPSTWWKIARELAFVAAFLYAYEFIRDHVVQSARVATSHALTVVHLEQRLGLFWEHGLQSVALRWRWIFHILNPYYGGTHFLVPAAALIWLGIRRPDRFAHARNVLAVTTAAAFTFFWLCPVAPPRLLPARYGIVDTLRHLAGGHVEVQLIDRAGNAYAAMPSLHCAWALWATLALFPVLRTRWARAIVLAYPIVTVVVVVTTGNHFVLDALAGAALVVAAEVAVSRLPAVIGAWGIRPLGRLAATGAVPASVVPTDVVDVVDLTGNAAETGVWVRSDDDAARRPLPAGRPSDP